MRLFHYSDDPGIELFVPRPIRVWVKRPAGMAWLNGPLVWALADSHEAMYLFPRECPRIVLWATADTSDADRARWLDTDARAIAYVERAWLDRLETGRLVRYEFPLAPFEDIDDAGMWVAREAVTPVGKILLTDLPAELRRTGTELRVLDDLLPLRDVWQSTVHASGIRLRNAQNWGKPGWTHAKPGRPVVL